MLQHNACKQQLVFHVNSIATVILDKMISFIHLIHLEY